MSSPPRVPQSPFGSAAFQFSPHQALQQLPGADALADAHESNVDKTELGPQTPPSSPQRRQNRVAGLHLPRHKNTSPKTSLSLDALQTFMRRLDESLLQQDSHSIRTRQQIKDLLYLSDTQLQAPPATQVDLALQLKGYLSATDASAHETLMQAAVHLATDARVKDCWVELFAQIVRSQVSGETLEQTLTAASTLWRLNARPEDHQEILTFLLRLPADRQDAVMQAILRLAPSPTTGLPALIYVLSTVGIEACDEIARQLLRRPFAPTLSAADHALILNVIWTTRASSDASESASVLGNVALTVQHIASLGPGQVTAAALLDLITSRDPSDLAAMRGALRSTNNLTDAHLTLLKTVPPMYMAKVIELVNQARRQWERQLHPTFSPPAFFAAFNAVVSALFAPSTGWSAKSASLLLKHFYESFGGPRDHQNFAAFTAVAAAAQNITKLQEPAKRCVAQALRHEHQSAATLLHLGEIIRIGLQAHDGDADAVSRIVTRLLDESARGFALAPNALLAALSHYSASDMEAIITEVATAMAQMTPSIAAPQVAEALLGAGLGEVEKLVSEGRQSLGMGPTLSVTDAERLTAWLIETTQNRVLDLAARWIPRGYDGPYRLLERTLSFLPYSERIALLQLLGPLGLAQIDVAARVDMVQRLARLPRLEREEVVESLMPLLKRAPREAEMPVLFDWLTTHSRPQRAAIMRQVLATPLIEGDSDTQAFATLRTALRRLADDENVMDRSELRLARRGLAELMHQTPRTVDVQAALSQFLQFARGLGGVAAPETIKVRLGAHRGGASEVSNIVRVVDGHAKAGDKSPSLRRGASFQLDETTRVRLDEVLARAWHVIHSVPIDASDSRRMQEQQMARESLLFAIAQCVEDDGHLVCDVGMVVRLVHALGGFVPGFEANIYISPEQQLTMNSQALDRVWLAAGLGDSVSPERLVEAQGLLRNYYNETRRQVADAFNVETTARITEQLLVILKDTYNSVWLPSFDPSETAPTSPA